MNSFFQDPTTTLLRNSLNASTLKHKTISNNIANVNTSGYKRQTVKFADEMQKYLENPRKLSMIHTKPNHIGFKPAEVIDYQPSVIDDKTTSLRTDKNNVDIDMELAVLAENTVKFNVLSQTISKKLSLLRSAIRGGS